MRKFPIYNLLQELTMQGMMILLIIGYIAYDFMEVWTIYSYVLIGLCAIGVVLLFRRQVSSMIVAKTIAMVKDKQDLKVNRNFVFIGLVNLVVILFTLLHFYLYQVNGKDFDPLYSEYGFGALLGAGLWTYNFMNNQVIITDQGIVVGSKFSPSMLNWAAIEKAYHEKGTITIIPKQNFGIKSVEVRGIRATQQLTTLLRIHNKMK